MFIEKHIQEHNGLEKRKELLSRQDNSSFFYDRKVLRISYHRKHFTENCRNINTNNYLYTETVKSKTLTVSAIFASEQRTWHENLSKRSKNFNHATVVLIFYAKSFKSISFLPKIY